MSDYTLPPHLTLIVGMQGSGKTTFGLRYLVNAPNVACRFVWDDLGQAAHRLRMGQVSTSHGLEMALATRYVVYNPHLMFPGDLDSAFRFFCRWVYEVSCRSPGKKLVFIDEIWRFQNNHQIPRELAMLTQAARAENVELVTATQLPHKINASITGQSTELVCFRLDEDLALDEVRSLGIKADVQNLPLGQFVSLNRLSRATLCGKMF